MTRVELGTHTVTYSSFTVAMLINIVAARGIFHEDSKKAYWDHGGVNMVMKGLIRQRAKCEEQVTAATNHLSSFKIL